MSVFRPGSRIAAELGVADFVNVALRHRSLQSSNYRANVVSHMMSATAKWFEKLYSSADCAKTGRGERIHI